MQPVRLIITLTGNMRSNLVTAIRNALSAMLAPLSYEYYNTLYNAMNGPTSYSNVTILFNPKTQPGPTLPPIVMQDIRRAIKQAQQHNEGVITGVSFSVGTHP